MEQKSKALLKLKTPNDNVSPLNLTAIAKHNRHHLLSPHSLHNHHNHAAAAAADYTSTIMKYLCAKSPAGDDFSPSPLSPIDGNIIRRSLPRKQLSEAAMVVDEDDVLVMDGFSVSGGLVSSPRSRIGYSKEICRAWEDHGVCRYGSSCHFAHGNEELRPRFSKDPNKKTLEAWMSKSYRGAVSSPLTPKGRYANYQILPKPATSPPPSHMVSPMNTEQIWDSPGPITPTKTEIMNHVLTSAIKSDYPSKIPIAEFEQTCMTDSPSGKTSTSIKSTITANTTPFSGITYFPSGRTEHSSGKTSTSSTYAPPSSIKTTNTTNTTSFSGRKPPRPPADKTKYPNSPPNPKSISKPPILTSILRQIWSPLDDGIQVTLPSQPNQEPSREAINAHINSVLYGSTTKRRLPVFTQICQ
ncbi:hypothetical protein ACFE04_022851 [Oxalis oulophora]